MSAPQPPQDAASLTESASESPSKKFKSTYYRTFQTVMVRNVLSKFENAAKVESSEFFCPRDPASPSFQLRLKFWIGRHGAQRFTTHIFSDDTAFISKELIIEINDDHGLLQRTHGKKTVQVEKEKAIGFKSSVSDITPTPSVTNETTWKYSFTSIYYVGPNPIQNLPRTPHLKVQSDLLRLLEEATNSDVTFVVQGEHIKAHKAILLARSEYFENMFRSDVKENETNKVVVPDMEPQVFRAMLQFVYSGLPPTNLAEIALDLLVAADKYCLDEIKEACSESLCDQITRKNVADVLLVADSINHEELKSRAILVLRGCMHKLTPSGPTMSKLKTNPALMTELLMHFAQE